MNPCIIIHNRALERYEAYNEDGRLCCVSQEGWVVMANRVRCFQYEQVPLNSRLGRTLYDKLPLSVQMATRHG